MNINITQTLILLSIIFSFSAFSNENMYFFWMGKQFLDSPDIIKIIWQFFLYSFIHWWILHLLFNSVILYYFWNRIEEYLGSKNFLIFFICITLWVAGSLLLFSSWITVWISGFWMALMAFYTLMLYKIWDSEYKWWITFLIINIFIGFGTNISLIGHLSWAIFWGIFFVLYQKFYKKYQ